MSSLRPGEPNDGDCWKNSPRIDIQQSTETKDSKVFKGIIQKDEVLITLDSKYLRYEIKSETENHRIDYSNILCVKKSRKTSETCIYYLLDNSDNELKFVSLKIKFSSFDNNSLFTKLISKKVKKKRKLKNIELILDCSIETNGDIFESVLKPIFDKIDVTYHVTTIPSAEKFNESMQELNMANVTDGIFILGGDEMIHKVVNFIMNKKTEENSVNISVPLGIIPTGINNEIFHAMYTKDLNVEQIFFNYLLNNIVQIDVLNIKINNKSNLWGFNCQYGIWEPSKTNNFVYERIWKKIPKYAIQELNIKYIAIDENIASIELKCDSNCDKCFANKSIVTSSPVFKLNQKKNKVEEETRNFITSTLICACIIINSIPCRSEKAQLGYTPACHLSNNYFDGIILRCNQDKEIKKYYKLQSNGSHIFLPYIEYIRSNEVTFVVQNKNSWKNEQQILESKSIKEDNKNNEDIIVIEDSDISSEEEQEIESKEVQNDEIQESMKTKRKSIEIFGQMKKLLKTTQAAGENASYKKPVILDFERSKMIKSNKRKKKEEKRESQSPKWMIDYNLVEEVVMHIEIKLHPGLLSFFSASN